MLDFILYSLVMLLVGIITDLIWAFYIKKLASGEDLQAAFYSVGTGICTLFLLEGFMVYRITCIFWLLGLFIGTWQSGKIVKFVDKLHKRLP